MDARPRAGFRLSHAAVHGCSLRSCRSRRTRFPLGTDLPAIRNDGVEHLLAGADLNDASWRMIDKAELEPPSTVGTDPKSVIQHDFRVRGRNLAYHPKATLRDASCRDLDVRRSRPDTRQEKNRQQRDIS